MPAPTNVVITQLSNTLLEVDWDGTALAYVISGATNPPPYDTETLGLFTRSTIQLVETQFWATPPAAGDTVGIKVQDADDNAFTETQIDWTDMTPASWTTIADVRTMLGPLEAAYTDQQIMTAIQTATARLASVFCKDVTVDETTGLPTDVNVQTATTVMASRILTDPATGVPPVQGGQITSERMGSYSYSIRPGTAPSSSGPQTIDGYLKELVGGYLCPGYAGIPIQTDIWPYDEAEVLEATAGVTTYP